MRENGGVTAQNEPWGVLGVSFPLFFGLPHGHLFFLVPMCAWRTEIMKKWDRKQIRIDN
jgi:hypothetical protein